MMRTKYLVVTIIAILLLSAFAAGATAFTPTTKQANKTVSKSTLLQEKIDSKITNSINKLLKQPEKISPKLLNNNANYERIIVVGKGNPLTVKSSFTIVGTYRIGNIFISTGYATKAEIKALSHIPTVSKILPDLKITYHTHKAPTSAGPLPDLYNARQILGVDQAYNVYGINGSGVNVAITDTGTFFGNPDLQSAIARDSNNNPIYLDADGESFGYTPLYFVMNVTGGMVSNWTTALPAYASGAAFINSSGVFLPTMGLTINMLDMMSLPYSLINYTMPYNAVVGVNATSYIHGPVVTMNDHGYTIKYQVFTFGYMTAPLIFMPLYFYGYPWYSVPVGDINIALNYGFTAVPALLPVNMNTGVASTVYVSGLSTILSDINWAFGTTIWPGAEPAQFVYNYSGTYTWEQAHHTNDSTIYLVENYPSLYGVYADLGTIGGYMLFPNWTSYFAPPPSLSWFLGAAYGNLVHGILPGGTGFTVATSIDATEWHGTFTASVVASRGVEAYNLYNNGTYYHLPGIAPGSHIIGVTALWIGDVWYGWMWSSGFEYNTATMTWQYTGAHRAQINSNSWGISEWPYMLTGIGYDAISALENLLMLPGSFNAPNYPGTIFVQAMGNGGPGYGTDTVSGGAFLPISVGASTSFNWIHAFGWGVSNTSGNVIPWSDRGPAYTGNVKPDVVAIGAFSWVPASINYWDGESWLPPGVGIFGGTSQATPMTAGVAALVVQAMNQAHIPFNPLYVKNVLMATASDLNNDPFVQGAGQLNAFEAVTYVLEQANLTHGYQAFITTTASTYNILAKQIDTSMEYWMAEPLPSGNHPVSTWFAGYLNAGTSTSTTFTVHNPSNMSMSVTPGTQILSLLKEQSVTHVWNYTNSNLGYTAWVTPSASYPYHQAETFINVSRAFGAIPSATVLMVVTVTTPMVQYEAQYGLNNNPNMIMLWAANWNGATMQVHNGYGQNVTIPATSGINVVNYAYNLYNTQVLSISNPTSTFTNTPLLMVRLYNTSGLPFNPDVNTYSVHVYYFTHASWQWIHIPKHTITIAAHSTATFKATITVPENAANGIYGGFVTVTSANGQKQLIPTSVVVKTEINAVNAVYKSIPDRYSSAPLYSNSKIYGMGALDWRYESGDVRFYYFDVNNPNIAWLNISFTWLDPGTSVDLFAIDPSGFLVSSSVVNVTGDNIGNGVFFASNLLPRGTYMLVPINLMGFSDLGMWTIVIHNVNSGGAVWPVNITWQVQTYGLTIYTPLPGAHTNINGGPYHIKYTTPNTITSINASFITTISGLYMGVPAIVNVTMTTIKATNVYNIYFYPIVALANYQYNIIFRFNEVLNYIHFTESGLTAFTWNFWINTIAPILTITAPANGNVPYTMNNTITIAGTTNANSVSINGVTVTVVNGQFSVVETLVAGLNTFIIKATDIYGNTVSQTVTVLYLPEIAQLQNQVHNLSLQISGLNTTVSNIITKIANLKGQLSTLNAEVNYLNKTYGIDLSNLQNEVTALQQKLNTLNSTLVTQGNKVSTVSTGVNNNYIIGTIAIIIAVIAIIIGVVAYVHKPKLPKPEIEEKQEEQK